MRSTSGENDFLIPSANPPDNKRSQRPTWPGFLFTLLLAVGVFGVSTGAARFFFPRGLAGRPGASERESNFFSREDDGGYKTWECAASITGDPVMKGADLVSYFSLTEDQPAKFGTEQHEASYNGYRFLFVSEENKALFEAEPLRYIPMWGGFCAYGVAEEDWWTRANLGPDTDPNSWAILEGGNLYFFRSEYPKSLFMENVGLNLKLGEDNWETWWGDAVPAGGGKGSPLNTACFCDVETCLDF